MQFNNFQILKKLILHNYQTYVIDIWIHFLYHKIPQMNWFKDCIFWLFTISSDNTGAWAWALNNVSIKLYNSSVKSSQNKIHSLFNQKFKNHQNYCVYVKLYLNLQYTIKHTDIEFFQWTLKRVAVIFQAVSTETPHYV